MEHKRRVNMRMSRFNVTVKLGDQVIIYNTLSGGMLKLDEEYTKTLKRIQETGILCEGEFKENLLKGKMIVEEEFDEIKYLKAQNNILRFSNQLREKSLLNILLMGMGLVLITLIMGKIKYKQCQS